MRPEVASAMALGIEAMRLRYSYVPLPVYKKAVELFTMLTDRLKKFGPLAEEKRKNARHVDKYYVNAWDDSIVKLISEGTVL